MIWGAEVEAFVAANIPDCERGFGKCRAMGFIEGGRLVAGVVFHNWSPETQVIELSAASIQRRWLTRSRLSAIFGYPFDQIGCRIVVARISERNARARRIWRSLGADEYIIPALRSPTESEVIYTLSREAWKSSRFLSQERKNGQTNRARAA